MKRQKLEIGHALTLVVHWHDKVADPPKTLDYEGEVIEWRDRVVVVRIKDYGVLRFWKKNGLELGNRDRRRGFAIDWRELEESLKPAPGVDIALALEPEP
jgi:hypothetical protein